MNNAKEVNNYQSAGSSPATPRSNIDACERYRQRMAVYLRRMKPVSRVAEGLVTHREGTVEGANDGSTLLRVTNEGTCRDCGSKIYWFKTWRGKNIPLEDKFGSYRVEGKLAIKDADGAGFSCHLDSCPSRKSEVAE